jgi:hypothetical protein
MSRFQIFSNGSKLTGALALVLTLGGCATAASGGPTNQAPVATTTAIATATLPPTATATSAPTAQASVIAVTSSIVTVGANSSGSATASCPSGEPLLGGGFIVEEGNDNTGISPDDSYPSSSSTWKVTASTLANSMDVRAIAVCLKANFTVTMQTAQTSNGGGTTTATCPSGSVVTGGGFTSGGGTNAASQPKGNAWQVVTGITFGGSANPTAYARCATQGLKAAGIKTKSKTAPNGSTVSNGAACSSGQYPVGGGYNGYLPGSDSFWRVFLNSPDTGQGTVSSGWQGEVASGEPSNPSFTISSICATH